MNKQVSGAVHILIFLLLIVLLGTCASSLYLNQDAPVANLAAASISTPLLAVAAPDPLIPTPVPTAFPTVDIVSEAGAASGGGWSLIKPGLERRVIPIYDNTNQLVESLHLWRLDQNYFRLDVAFDASPKSLEIWQSQTNALMVVNGGFYSIENEQYFPDGLTIINGMPTHSLNGFEGMLALKDAGAEVRWLAEKAYDPAEPLQAALQSFPILVEPGGRLGYGAERDSNASARRTVIAQDRDGRLLFIIAPQGYFSLHQLSVYLTESDLDLDIALNLDGGGSTGILLADPFETIPPSRPLPFVILVYAR